MDFWNIGIYDFFVQDNYSKSKAKVLRGLHHQKEPKAQSKLVRCVVGKIFDVAVDIRPYSPTRYKYVSVELSADKGDMLYIPKGFAHGFLVLSDYAEVSYKASDYYSKEYEDGIAWNDSTINIKWPTSNPILSDKDRSYNLL